MPVISFDARDLEALLGRRVDRAGLVEAIPRLGAEVASSEGDAWSVEFFPDRPDLYSAEGLARALRAYLGTAPGLRAYPVAKPRETVAVEASVRAVRPLLRAAVVTGLRFSDRRVRGIMELQEDLHWGVGARRRKASIGVHDKARLVPPYTYKAVGLDDVAFVPLQGTEPMTPREVLGKHPKGRDYAHLVGEQAPLLVDSLGQVLSFPPIINGTLTTVTEATTEVLVDVTGTDPRAVDKALNLVATHLAEQGGKVEAVRIREGKRNLASPDLAPQAWTLRLSEAERLLGARLTAAQAAKALRRMGHGARPGKGGRLTVQVPCYRVDVLHEVDLVEDVAKGLGYDALGTELPRATTFGRPSAREREGALAREVLLGLGFTEAMTLSLTSDEQEGKALGLPSRPAVHVANPITEDHTALRTTLLGSLLGLLQKNVHRDYPQAVFEVGDVVWWSGQGAPANARMAAWVKAHSKAGFSEAKGIALALARDLRLPADVASLDPADPFAQVFLAGRAAVLGPRDAPWGRFGEVHPRTLEAFGIGQPAIAMEMRLGGAPLAETGLEERPARPAGDRAPGRPAARRRR